jgi:hypothetical protein
MLLAMLLAMPAIGLLLADAAPVDAAPMPICADAEPAAAAAKPIARVNLSAVFFIFLLLLFKKTIRAMRMDASQLWFSPIFLKKHKKQFLQHHPFVARFADLVQFFLLSSAKKNRNAAAVRKDTRTMRSSKAFFLRRAKKKAGPALSWPSFCAAGGG